MQRKKKLKVHGYGELAAMTMGVGLVWGNRANDLYSLVKAAKEKKCRRLTKKDERKKNEGK